MFRLLFFFHLLSISFYCTYATDIKYDFEYIKKGNYFKVELEIKNHNTTRTKLYIPSYLWGVDVTKSVKNLFISVSNNQSISNNTNNLLITHDCNDVIKISYEIHNPDYEYNNNPTYNSTCIKPDKFFINGSFGLVIPESIENSNIIFRWKNLNKNIFTNFGVIKNNKLKIITNPKKLHETFFLMGDAKLFSLPINKNYLVKIIVQGNLPFIENKFIDYMEKIIKFQNNFFSINNKNCTNNKLTKEYLIFLEKKDYKLSINGNKQDNFQVLSLSKENNDLKKILYIFAHERLHKWFGQIIKDDNQGNKWFFEGFTDYYTYYLNYLYGVIDFDEYLESYNECIRQYYFLPTSYATNISITNNFWNGYAFERITYLRGRIFANELDYLIRKISNKQKTLDDLIRHIISNINNSIYDNFEQLFISEFKKFVGIDISKTFNNQIILGKLEIKSPLLFNLATPNQLEVFIPDYGFNFVKSFEKKLIIGLKNNTNAYKAGIRNKQKFLGIYLNDFFTDSIVQVVDGDKKIERNILYKPNTILVKIPIYKKNL